MTVAVVTGGAGFIGSHVTDLLVAEGFDVRVVDDLSTGERGNVNAAAQFIAGSVTDGKLMGEACAGAEYVFHLAALARIQPSFDDPVSHEEVNVVGTVRCVEAVKGSPTLKKLVISASSACYGTPDRLPTPESAPISCLSPYALQKYAAEQYALILGERFRIPVVALRYFNVYGPRSFNPRNPHNAYTSVLGVFRRQRAEGKPLTITGSGKQQRDFVHVYDVARANLAAARSAKTGEVYNVGSGSTISINDLSRLFAQPTTYIPERPGESMITLADIGKIQSGLGWSPTIDLKRGMDLLA